MNIKNDLKSNSKKILQNIDDKYNMLKKTLKKEKSCNFKIIFRNLSLI